jgi:hypothetical protein
MLSDLLILLGRGREWAALCFLMAARGEPLLRDWMFEPKGKGRCRCVAKVAKGVTVAASAEPEGRLLLLLLEGNSVSGEVLRARKRRAKKDRLLAAVTRQ